MRSELLAGIYIRQVNFDERNPRGQKRIPYGDTGMRVSRGIYNNKLNFLFRSLLNTADNITLGVGLISLQCHAFLLRYL